MKNLNFIIFCFIIKLIGINCQEPVNRLHATVEVDSYVLDQKVVVRLTTE